MANTPNLGRLLTAMVTPFDEKGEVDYSQARKLAQALIESGSDGVVVVGTTGESPTLTKKEEVKLFAEIKDAIGDKATVVAGTGSNATAEAIETTQQAEKVGVDACLLVVPYYNKPPQEGLYQHYKTIAESTSLPCILYNVPGRTGISMSAETTIRLSAIENIIGTKEASGNLDSISRIISNTPDDFLVYSGNDNDTFAIMNMGGYGVISVVSHLAGKQLQQMLQFCLEGKTSEAAKIHHHLLPLVDMLFMISSPIPIKYSLNHIGFSVGNTRLPLVPPDPKTAGAIEETLKKYTLDLPVN